MYLIFCLKELQLLILSINHIGLLLLFSLPCCGVKKFFKTVSRGGRSFVVDEGTKEEVAINAAMEELAKPTPKVAPLEKSSENEDIWKALNENPSLMSLASSVTASSRVFSILTCELWGMK